ncbi:hypothetical protein NP233_g6748 [Leucocoprinus birnbaumii]|uniref:Uncharacterized protein n=1 Tax=Leucocoprinus birnbaumii TaxID=56174 RepID=A0AAD5VQG8_9AGAR|nr:hypothetical protein NP233_g6748 [Leucocoprinus birnbaumii]
MPSSDHSTTTSGPYSHHESQTDLEKSPSHSHLEIGSLDKAANSPTEQCSEDVQCGAIPDGGLKAWGVVLGAFLIQFCTSGQVMTQILSLLMILKKIQLCLSRSVFFQENFEDYYTRVYLTEYSASAISWIGSVNTFILLAMGLVGGRLYDRGYVGSLLMSLSLFALSFAKQNQYAVVLVTQGIGMGLGASLAYIPSFAIVAQYFDKKRAMVFPLVAAGVSAGAALTPIMINNLLQKRHLSFATTTRIHAGMMTVLLITICLLVRPRLTPPTTHASLSACFKKFAKDKAYVILVTGFTLFGLGLFFPIFFLQLAATTHGLDPDFAFYSLVVLNSCSSIGRVLSALVAHKTRVDWMAVGSAIVCGCIIFAFLHIGSAASVVLVGIIYGFAFGILVATMAPLTNILTDNPAELGQPPSRHRFCLDRSVGSLYPEPCFEGLKSLHTGFGELVGPPIMGALLTGYRWWRPTVFSGVVLLAAATCFATVSIIVGNKFKMSTN